MMKLTELSDDVTCVSNYIQTPEEPECVEEYKRVTWSALIVMVGLVDLRRIKVGERGMLEVT